MAIDEHMKPWTRDVTEDWERIFGKKDEDAQQIYPSPNLNLDDIRAMRQRRKIADKCEKFVGTDHGLVMLQADNWQAIADVLEQLFDGKKEKHGKKDCGDSTNGEGDEKTRQGHRDK